MKVFIGGIWHVLRLYQMSNLEGNDMSTNFVDDVCKAFVKVNGTSAQRADDVFD